MNINKYLTTDCDILEFDSLGSTNDTAKELGLQNARENTVIIAKRQTAGRGRLGRQFYSPEQSGIYMSIILRPDFKAENATFITVAAAVAVAEVLDLLCRTNTKIKWVNDIYLNNRKVCGILTESTFTGNGFFSVLGIGINLYSPENDFPSELKEIAGAVLYTKPDEDLKAKIIAAIIDRFEYYYNNLTDKKYLTVYREKSNLIGKKVKFLEDGKEITASVHGINDDAHLIVKLESGEIKELFAGEVSVKLK